MDGAMRIEPHWHETRNPTPMSNTSNSLLNNDYTSYENINANLRDSSSQKRGRNREQLDFGNFSSQEGFTLHNNNYGQRYPGRQHRRARSADSRPQYNNGNNTEAFNDFSSAHKMSSYREGRGFSSTTSRRNPNRANSDVGVEGRMDSMRFYRLPRYEAVIHDDSIVYSSSKQMKYMRNAISAENNTVTTRQTLQNNNSPQMDNIDHPQLSATREQMNRVVNNYDQPDNNHHQSLRDRERQYYNYAKENLITFGTCDEPTASTGLSQEELLQHKRREEVRKEVRNKRKEKRRNRNRIMNFPSNLLRGGNPHHNDFSPQKNDILSSSPNYQKMKTSLPREDDYYRENIHESNGNSPNSNGNATRGKGIRGSMRNIKSQNHTDRANGFKNNHGVNHPQDASVYETTQQNFFGMHDDSTKYANREIVAGIFNHKKDLDGFIQNPSLLQGNDKNHNHISVQVNLDESNRMEKIPNTRTTHIRPTYADFTPRSAYSKRDSFFLNDQGYSKNRSPTSIVDAHMRNSGGVRWNENLTQQEFIVTPQSTKLRPDSDKVQSRHYAGKPKSILRSQGSSSYVPKFQIEQNSSECSANKYPERLSSLSGGNDLINSIVSRAEAIDNDPGFPTMMGFVDGSGRSLSPIGIDRLGGANGKFPESYVHFIEAVASVVIQTKVRQKLAKNKVEALQKELNETNDLRRFSEAKMNPMVRKSYLRERSVRRGNGIKLKGRKDVELDFYALAAIQIQAAFRGWWVRDCLGVDNYCATMIQKTYRGSCCRKDFLIILDRIIMVQSICRRWLAMDAAVTRIYCIVRIQAVVRGSLVRIRMKFNSLENDVFHAAAVIIQTAWRSFWCEMNFLRTYEDILVVQSMVRGWTARRSYRLRVEAKKSEFSKRHIIHKTSKNPKFPSKFRKNASATYYNHVDYMRRTLGQETKSGMSQSQHTTLHEVSKSTLVKRENHLFMKDRSEGSKSGKRIQMKKTTASPWKARGENSRSDNVRRQALITYGHGIVSTSRADIEKRRKNKEQELKVRKEEENRRLELQAAEIAEMESRREKMAMKAEARKKENSINKHMSELTESISVSGKSSRHSDEQTRSGSSHGKEIGRKPGESKHDAFANFRKQFNKFDPVTTSRAETDDKAESVEKVRTEIDTDCISKGGGSLFVNRMHDLNFAKGGGQSLTKNDFIAAKSSTDKYQSKGGPDLKKGVMPTKTKSDVTDIHRSYKIDQRLGNPAPKAPWPITENDTPKRMSRNRVAYHEEMHAFRSDSEQRRIDAIHNIFEQAGLLSRK